MKNSSLEFKPLASAKAAVRPGDIVEVVFLDHWLMEEKDDVPRKLEPLRAEVIGKVVADDDDLLTLYRWLDPDNKDLVGIVKLAILSIRKLQYAQETEPTEDA